MALADTTSAVLPAALVLPARLSSRASEGLFTAITRAGDRLVAVGERGRIVISDNDGRVWRQVETPTSVTLTGIAFGDPSNGWAVGQMGVILKTGDGGETWQRVLDGVRANNLLLGAATAAQQAKNANATSAANLQSAQQFVSGGPTVPFLSVMPLAANDVIAAGGFGMAFESHDGGAHWASIFDDIPNPNGLNIYHLLPIQGALYLIGEQGLIVRRTADGNYAALSSPFPGTFFGGLQTNNGELLLYGLQGTVLLSTDSGAHWSVSTSGASVGIDAGVVASNGTIILGDLAGDLLVSKDDGKSFQLVQAGEPVAALVQAKDGAIIVAGPLGFRRIEHVDQGAGV